MGRVRRAVEATWVVVIGLAVVVTIPYALLATSVVHQRSDCPLGLELERSRSEVVERRTFPPRVVCRHEYETPAGDELFPPSGETTDATAPIVVALATTALAALTGAVAVRRRRSVCGEPPHRGEPAHGTAIDETR